ncbi:hypothetical protein HHL28_09835 [Aerophototrophica crusticola]|uniref:Uncharacterized protein n=1 Tax=Aerophototrophica crusticola TaxID=1709002 RepID=A0A858R7G9_9PROT|nr:hypothetical protein HHL28_09835 [Rhodospirillaceae bacterium B3]
MPHHPAFRLRSLPDGRAILSVAQAAGVPVLLVSDPGAASFAGAGWWRALTDDLRAEFPDLPFTTLLDCGDSAGAVMGALREGVRALAFSGPPGTLEKLHAMAVQLGGQVIRPPEAATDLRGLRKGDASIRQAIIQSIDSKSL